MGAGDNGGVATIVNSTLTGNSALGGAAAAGANGGSGFGGALFNLDGSATLLDDTLADNTADKTSSGGAFAGGAVYNLAFGNNVTSGLPVAATLRLSNSILSGAPHGASDLFNNVVNGNGTNLAVVTADAPNLIEKTAATIGGTQPIIGIDPMLGALASNGGPTQTLALLTGSPAIDAGSVAAVPAGVTTDQRGAGFARISGSTVDLGAFQVQTANQRFLSHVYLDLLHRAIDPAGMAFWGELLNAGVSQTNVVLGIEQDPGHEFYDVEVQSVFQQYLHRAAESTAVTSGANFLAAGNTVEQMDGLIVTSPEFLNGQGGGTYQGFLNAFYEDALGRPVDAAGQQAFGNGTPGSTAAAILSSNEYHTDLVIQDYAHLLDRGVDPGDPGGEYYNKTAP
jgi:hypothetical protein